MFQKQKPTKAFWNAYSALHSEKPVFQEEVTPKPRKKRTYEEDGEQVKLCTWLDKMNILYYAIPNGGKRNAIEGYKFKRSGVKAGVPDLCIPIARKCHHGLYIELKRVKGGVVSDIQKEWLAKLSREGYIAVVANGSEAAQKIIKHYLGLN